MKTDDRAISSLFRFFCSWSGGKDSCLALWRALQEGHRCASLFTLLDETGERSRSHSLPLWALQAQADSLGIPLSTSRATWEQYEETFKERLACFLREGVVHGVFGDIDLEDHRLWEERVCRETGLAAHLPLWKEARRDLMDEFMAAGFQALIVVIHTGKMPASYLGRRIDAGLIEELEAIGVDACGENGEFHTFVFDGPLFQRPIRFRPGETVSQEDYVFLPILPEARGGDMEGSQ